MNGRCRRRNAPPPTASSPIRRPARTTTYGKVAEAAAKIEPPADVKLKDPKDWKIAGKGLKRLDTADKTTGKMIYGIDVKLPGMLNAAIKACPVFGGKLKSYDEAKVAGMKGVKKVVQGRRLAPSPSSPTPGGTPRPRSMRCRSSGTKARTPRSPARRSPNGSTKVSTTPSRPMSATRTATPKRRSPAPPRRSRRSTTIPTRTTPRWSR